MPAIVRELTDTTMLQKSEVFAAQPVHKSKFPDSADTKYQEPTCSAVYSRLVVEHRKNRRASDSARIRG